MEKPDVNALAERMINAVKAHVAAAAASLTARLDDLEARLLAIPAGPRGEKGEAGARGADVTPEQVLEIVLPVVEQVVETTIAKIPRPKPGEPGRDGKDGESVHPDTVALMVREQVKAAISELPTTLAADGKDGRDGVDGKEGAPGRDAAELDILPSIDEAKSYRRGTWASHNGGLIRASRATDPVVDGALIDAGWVVMVEGVAGVVVTQGEDPREIEVTCALTSGMKSAAPFRIPMVIDMGVWREGSHEKGDHVSWDGSGWIAQRATTDKPGTSDAWRLSTKRGRDGKDGAAPQSSASPIVRTK